MSIVLQNDVINDSGIFKSDSSSYFYSPSSFGVGKIILTNVNSLPRTWNLSAYPGQFLLYYVISNPNAQIGDLTVEANPNKFLTISGTLIGTTDITLYYTNSALQGRYHNVIRIPTDLTINGKLNNQNVNDIVIKKLSYTTNGNASNGSSTITLYSDKIKATDEVVGYNFQPYLNVVNDLSATTADGSITLTGAYFKAPVSVNGIIYLTTPKIITAT